MKADTNFIVTGLSRSGTTYMMRCIEAGGIPVARDNWRYELTKKNRMPVLKNFVGKCLKLFMFRLIKYDVSNCAIIFMSRNPYKILASCVRFDRRIPLDLVKITKTHRGWAIDFSRYERLKKECLELWQREARSCAECAIEGMDTYGKRLEFFSALRDSGWPINAEAAANVENDEEDRLKKRGWGEKLAWT